VYANQVVTATTAPAQTPAPQVTGYPNPVETSYRLTNVAENSPVKVEDVTGRVVLQTKVSSGAVDVSSLRSGIYILLIQSKNTLQRLKVRKQ